MYDVITVGSSTVDVFADVESELIKIKTAHHEEEMIAYPCGSKILIKKLEFMTGGGGTNTSVALKRLGLKVAYLGKIGDDENSDMILNKLKSEKIDFVGVKGKGSSGYSIILDSIEGDRTILAHKGVNNKLVYSEISLKKLKTKWFYFSSMVGKSFETLKKLTDYAEKSNIRIAFNPSNYLAEKGADYLKDILDSTDLLVLNREEASLIVGEGSPKKLLKKLTNLGPEVVITEGKKGVYTLEKGKLVQVIANDIEVKETTGAGDAFASTFLAGRIKNKDVKTCLRLGLVNAESVIMHKGAKNGLLSYRTLLSKIKKSPPKIKKVN
jgi:ribokinase